MENANVHENDTELKVLTDRINESKNSKIVVAGGKQSGKSEVLKYYAKNYNNKNKAIVYLDYRDFSYKATLGDKEYDFYYELVMVKKMLDSVKQYNSRIYSNFKVFEKYIDKELNKFREFLLTRFYVNENIKFKKGTLLTKMLEIFRINGISNVDIVIDHFDFVGESSERFQKFMGSYAYKFRKFIVTTNENMNEEKRNKLEENRVSIIDVHNGEKLEVVKKILISYLNKLEQEELYDINYIIRLHNLYKKMKDDSFYELLIQRCDGNIEVMSQVLIYYITGDDLDNAINSSVRLQKELDSLTYKRVLHL